jgi:hypothetical protein
MVLYFLLVFVLVCFLAVLECVNYLWLCAYCVFLFLFSGDRIERGVYRGGRSLCLSGRRRPGTSY